MALTKANQTLLSAVTTSQTSTPFSLATGYSATVFNSLTVTGTPTGSATVQCQLSIDGTNYYNFGPLYSFVLQAGTYVWPIALDPNAVGVQIVFVAQTGGTTSTLTSQLGEITGI